MLGWEVAARRMRNRRVRVWLILYLWRLLHPLRTRFKLLAGDVPHIIDSPWRHLLTNGSNMGFFALMSVTRDMFNAILIP